MRGAHIVHAHGNGAVLWMPASKTTRVTGDQGARQHENSVIQHPAFSHDRVLHVRLVKLHHGAACALQLPNSKIFAPEATTGVRRTIANI